MSHKFVEVVTSLPIDRTFQYRVTGKESFAPGIGKRVHIPFRSSRRVGYIVAMEDSPQVEDVRPLIDIIDEEPVFTPEMIDLAEWIKNNYFCSWGEALEAMIPGALKRGKISMTSRISEEEEKVEPTSPHEPNPEQKKVLEDISECLDEGRNEVFLLHGITGSGKTEIYLQAMEKVLSRGGSGVVLVPEISLTPQTVERFRSRFDDMVAVFHSKMLQSSRFAEWKRIREGKARVVVGPRSAVFSPITRPGIFIVDEEHEPSYKQEDSPRYHAREVAIRRAAYAGVPVILGSATPSLESYHKAVQGDYKLVELTQRIREKALPRVKLVDMRMEFDTRVGHTVISRAMEDILGKDISKGHQALIFQNRRGYSTFVLCRKCGYVLKCAKCDSPMVLHREKSELICHYCNRRLPPPAACPDCREEALSYRGAGTERIEKAIKKILPEARVARMDSDTMSKRGAHAKVLKAFKKHELDVIVGTQMIAKGLDFPKVTLVGVVSADANLNLPDFRSGERTFSLITQVAGRAGRGDLGGEVVVQTYTPEHYAVNLAAKHDFKGFYDREIDSRRDLLLPPFVHLAKITVRGRKEDNVIKSVNRLADKLRARMPDADLLGPAPAPISRLRGYYRWNVLLRAPDREKMVSGLRKALKGHRKGTGIYMAVDVDPMSM
ncbi:MAG: primosomal protein N' [Candidatus Omnitrophica bacterium]|nr:primosomal protein N' [Candidatus Omnitrophota bacterium]